MQESKYVRTERCNKCSRKKGKNKGKEKKKAVRKNKVSQFRLDE